MGHSYHQITIEEQIIAMKKQDLLELIENLDKKIERYETAQQKFKDHRDILRQQLSIVSK